MNLIFATLEPCYVGETFRPEVQVMNWWVRDSIFCVAIIAASSVAMAQDCVAKLQVEFLSEEKNKISGVNHVFRVPRSEYDNLNRYSRRPYLFCALSGFDNPPIQNQWYDLCLSGLSADRDYLYAQCTKLGN